jgi:uncharacterized protein (DUF1501 family)
MSNSASRREFLKSSGLVIMAGAGGAFFTPEQFLMAQASGIPGAGSVDDDRNKPTLVTIFLRGGADSLNALVPYGDPLYYKARPGISIGEKGEGDKPGVLKVRGDAYWGLNSRLKPLVPLIEEGMCIPIVNVGSPDGTRSHFEAQDNMERGCTREKKMMSGWLNRYLELSKKPYDKPLRGLSAMTLLPRSLRGRYPVLAGTNSAEAMDEFEDVYTPQNLVGMTAREGGQGESGSRLEDRPRGDELLKIGQNADETRDIITKSGAQAVERIKALEKAYGMETSGEYPGGHLGSQLRTIARVIKANVGLEVAQADYDGWDHHRGQGGSVGQHSNMLGHLAQCINAFTKDLGGKMNRVLLLVQSEFGRTVQENGAQGTDHGFGGFMLVVGGNAMLKANNKGAGIMGVHKSLADLKDGRYQVVTTDFRTVYAEALERLFAFDPYKSKIFPAYKGSPQQYLNFVKQVTHA